MDVLTDIESQIFQLQCQLTDLELDAQHLRSLDPVQAVPHYRKNGKGEARYLYLVHPQKDGVRTRDYIGSNPTKQAEALARCQAWLDLQETLTRHTAITRRLALVNRLLERALREAKGGDY